MRGIESQILKVIFQSSYYYFFEIAFVVSVGILFVFLFYLAWKEFSLLVSLVKIMIFAYSEELPVISPSNESNAGLKEVA